MGVKVQYNPSTGKVSYNPATGKVQVIVDATGSCADCVNPDQVSVTISGLTACCFTLIPDSGISGAFAPAFMDMLNSEHIIDSFGATNNCRYDSTFVVDEPEWFLTWLSSSVCSGEPDIKSRIYSFHITVVTDITETFQRVWLFYTTSSTSTLQFVQTWQSPIILPCYTQTLTPSDSSRQDCGDESLGGGITTEVINGTVTLGVVP